MVHIPRSKEGTLAGRREERRKGDKECYAFALGDIALEYIKSAKLHLWKL